jgi:phospholipid/cholesterol/gamma-HCH transport system substrate-binding protein
LIMKTKAVDNAKLGLFVLAGVLFMIITLYLIGKNRNMLGSNFTIKAVVSNVNGLVPGNNVRFKGIDVGTVLKIEIADDTSIYVTMNIDKKMKSYIKQNAIASIGTDGLMGNKLININSQQGAAPPVEEGMVIYSRKPIETDEMLRTLNTTNNNMERITANLREITVKINSSNSLWNLLSDTIITSDLKNAIKDFRSAGANTKDLTGNAKQMIAKYDEGEGLVETLFNDTLLTSRLDQSLSEIQIASKNTSAMMNDMKSVITSLKEGGGTAGLLLADTTLRNKLVRSAGSVEQGTSRFNENMEALKSNFLFRRYFKKQEKKNKKTSASKSDN